MKKQRTYEDKCHFIGRTTVLLGLFGTILFPLAMIVVLKVPVNAPVLLAAAAAILVVQIPGALCQFLSFAPIVGPSAMYIMVLTGNFANMKIPAAVSAMEAVGLNPADQTDENDVISTVAMATSTIVCEIIIVIGVLMMSKLMPLLLNPVLAPAFKNISPAVFGALFMTLLVKCPKLGIVPAVGCALLMKFTSIPTVLLLPITLVLSLIATNIMYKKGLLSNKKEKEESASSKATT